MSLFKNYKNLGSQMLFVILIFSFFTFQNSKLNILLLHARQEVQINMEEDLTVEFRMKEQREVKSAFEQQTGKS